MTHPQSPMVDYYPPDFEVDANGKRNAWECVVRIPFINETVLVEAVSNIDHQTALSEGERARNAPGVIHRYVPQFPRFRLAANGSESGVDGNIGGSGAALSSGADGVTRPAPSDKHWGNALASAAHTRKKSAPVKGALPGSMRRRQS
jgi:hypothetical protein